MRQIAPEIAEKLVEGHRIDFIDGLRYVCGTDESAADIACSGVIGSNGTKHAAT